jgi:hypothetical protein
MWQDPYVTQKLRELELELRRHHDLILAEERRQRPRRRAFAPVVRFAGRRVRSLGEALESWGSVRTEARG